MATAKTAMTPDVQTAFRGIVAKAWADEQFKQRLIDNPNQALSDAGISVPAGVHFVVVENEPNRVHLVLPSQPSGNAAVREMQHIESDYDPGF